MWKVVGTLVIIADLYWVFRLANFSVSRDLGISIAVAFIGVLGGFLIKS